LTALCSAQACGTTYSILIDEHARIVSHTLFFNYAYMFISYHFLYYIKRL